MKKLFIVAITALGFAFGAQAQEGFSAGGFIGLPVGNAGDGWSLSFGADVNYMFEVSDTFQAGIASGYQHHLGKSVDFEGLGSITRPAASFLPIAASGKFMASEDFSIGADLGYALGLSDGLDGGLYYRPKVGYKIADTTELNLSYTGVSITGGTFSSINLGVMFQL